MFEEDIMPSLLVKNAKFVLTMNRQAGNSDIIKDGGFFAQNGVITQVAASDKLPQTADEIYDAKDCVVIPGFVNTHHHLYQNLTRAVAQDELLFGWLKTLYPIWAKFTPDDFRIATAFGLAELALSGCTLCADHHYIFPNGAKLDDDFDGQAMIGTRLLATRGAMSIGQSKGGLPPDNLVENEDDIIADSERLIAKFHDKSQGAMRQVGIAPCSPFSVSQELMKNSAILARKLGVRLHTHLAENDEDIAYSINKFGCRPGQYAHDCGWLGEDVWHAHCVKLNHEEQKLFALTGTGVAHCACSNMRLGSGIAPIRAMRDLGVNIGLGVDGSASNDSANFVNEARNAMLLQRVQNGANAMSALEMLFIATKGGAQILGRHDCGEISVGKRADCAIFNLNHSDYGGNWDNIGAILFCGPVKPIAVYCESRQIIGDYQLKTMDMQQLQGEHKKSMKRLLDNFAHKI